MRATLAAFVIVIAIGIGCTSGSGTIDPQVQGDTCAVILDQADCVAQSGCGWFAYGRPCPNDGSYCPSGVCQAVGSGSGTGTGSGSGSSIGSAACACPNGGVCFEQIGGPAQQGSAGPTIECATPAAGSGDPCARIQGEGTCRPDDQVSGLCVCDNGIR
jgi:hypothetical protein